jgi:hypothetical protein
MNLSLITRCWKVDIICVQKEKYFQPTKHSKVGSRNFSENNFFDVLQFCELIINSLSVTTDLHSRY